MGIFPVTFLKTMIYIFEKYSDLEISFTDCISFVLINKNKINSVFSFDKHFSILGFNVFPPTTHR